MKTVDLVLICCAAVNKGKTDILEWLIESEIMTSQEIMTLVLGECEGMACCSERGLNWLVDHGAVWSADLFHNVFSQLRSIILGGADFDVHQWDISTEHRLWLNEKYRYHLTLGSNSDSCFEYALKWMYEGGCPMNEALCMQADPELWRTLVTHCRRP